MKLTRIPGAVGMGLAWAAAWAVVGMGIEFISDLVPGFVIGTLADIWPTELALAGILGGLLFSALLRIAEGRREFDDVPLSHVGLWGAVTGVVLGLTAFAGDFGNASTVFPVAWLRGAGMVGSVTLLATLSGIGSWVLHRLGGLPAPVGTEHPQP